MIRKLLILILAFGSVMTAAVGQNDFTEIITITILGYVIVLIALTFIYFFLIFMSKSLEKIAVYRKKRRDQQPGGKTAVAAPRKGTASLEAVTAILMALHLAATHKEEEEKAILTINKIVRPYSPWSSKIYNMRTNPWVTHR